MTNHEIELKRRSLPERIRYIADKSGNPAIASMLEMCADDSDDLMTALDEARRDLWALRSAWGGKYGTFVSFDEKYERWGKLLTRVKGDS